MSVLLTVFFIVTVYLLTVNESNRRKIKNLKNQVFSEKQRAFENEQLLDKLIFYYEEEKQKNIKKEGSQTD